MAQPSMDISIEDLIGKNINEIPYEYEPFGINDVDENTFLLKERKKHLFGRPVISIVLITDTELYVNRIMTDFRGSMDVEFYNFLIEKYGIPNKILKKGALRYRKEIAHDSLQIVETKSEYRISRLK
ncbi:MAG: hypothetical protein AAFX53_19240, partial [Bacteroidota bacterium]